MIDVWYEILAGGFQYNISYQQCDCYSWNGTSCCCWAPWDNHFPDCLRTFVSSAKLIYTCIWMFHARRFKLQERAKTTALFVHIKFDPFCFLHYGVATLQLVIYAVHCSTKSMQMGLNLIYIICAITWSEELTDSLLEQCHQILTFTSSSSIYFNIICWTLSLHIFHPINHELVNQ